MALDPSFYSGSAYSPTVRKSPIDNTDYELSDAYKPTGATTQPERSLTGGATASAPGAGANSVYGPKAPEETSSGLATSSHSNVIQDPYAPLMQHLSTASQNLESAYAAPHAGTARQVIGAILSRRNPGLGGLVSGETQRNRNIQQAQEDYGIAGSQMQAARTQQMNAVDIASKLSTIDYQKKHGDYFDTMANQKENPTDKMLDKGFDAEGNAVTLMQRPDNTTYTQKVPGMVNPTTQKEEAPLPPQDMSIGGQNHKVLFDKHGNMIKDLGISKLPAEKENEGTWTLDEDSQGNPALFNSKTGQMKAAPPGLAKSGTKAKNDAATEKLIGPARDAQQYANDYLANGRFTGAGDEALQEKFFELAKPTTGFRMTQPQIDMLQNSRSWMQSLGAHARHATTGTWFNDEQRKQIVSTMKDLADAKMKGQTHAGASGGGGASANPNDPLGILQ